MAQLAEWYQVSDEGILHDSTQADAGKNASAPISARLISDPTRYKICSNCFPKAAARQRAQGEPLPRKVTRGSGRGAKDGSADSRSAEGTSGTDGSTGST